MKMTATRSISIISVRIFFLLCLSSVARAESPTFAEAVKGITPSADLRLRAEYAEHEGKQDANALTARLRLGVETLAWQGLTAGGEFEATRAADVSAYNAAGVMGDPDRAVIADPESTELNQAYLTYRPVDAISLKGGRQRLVIDNARFVGDVGWRQNNQTFDAAVLRFQPGKNLDLFYGYVDRVQRIFGSESEGAQRAFSSDSHLVRLRVAPGGGWVAGVYGYWLDLENAPALSSQTFGGYLQHRMTLENEWEIDAHLEAAQQSDFGDQPADYAAEYLHGVLGAARNGFHLRGGVEQLGSDAVDGGERVAFQTPLATLHKFNGWADLFLSTPEHGLRDIYLETGAPLPAGFSFTAVVHGFEAEQGGQTYGNELDLLLSKTLSDGTRLLLKFADYRADGFGVDTRRVTVEMATRF